MYEQVQTTLRERIERGATLEEIETLIFMSRGLRADERRNLWWFAWNYAPTAEPVLH